MATGLARIDVDSLEDASAAAASRVVHLTAACATFACPPARDGAVSLVLQDHLEHRFGARRADAGDIMTSRCSSRAGLQRSMWLKYQEVAAMWRNAAKEPPLLGSVFRPV